MTNWRKKLETDPIFNLIIRKTVDEHPATDLEIELELDDKDAKLSIRPGHDWYFDYEKSGFRVVNIKWKYRLYRPSMTRCIFCKHVKWVIEASVLCKIFVNTSFDKDSNQVVMESWGNNNDKK